MHWQTIERQFLKPLRSEGLFVTIFGLNSPNSYVVDCTLYFTDTAEDGGPANPFSYDIKQPLRTTPHGACICCEQVPTTETVSRIYNYVPCPVCFSSVEASKLKRRTFRGVFHAMKGQVATFTGPVNGLPDIKPLTNETQIELILGAFRRATNAS